MESLENMLKHLINAKNTVDDNSKKIKYNFEYLITDMSENVDKAKDHIEKLCVSFLKEIKDQQSTQFAFNELKLKHLGDLESAVMDCMTKFGDISAAEERDDKILEVYDEVSKRFNNFQKETLCNKETLYKLKFNDALIKLFEMNSIGEIETSIGSPLAIDDITEMSNSINSLGSKHPHSIDNTKTTNEENETLKMNTESDEQNEYDMAPSSAHKQQALSERERTSTIDEEHSNSYPNVSDEVVESAEQSLSNTDQSNCENGSTENEHGPLSRDDSQLDGKLKSVSAEDNEPMDQSPVSPTTDTKTDGSKHSSLRPADRSLQKTECDGISYDDTNLPESKPTVSQRENQTGHISCNNVGMEGTCASLAEQTEGKYDVAKTEVVAFSCAEPTTSLNSPDPRINAKKYSIYRDACIDPNIIRAAGRAQSLCTTPSSGPYLTRIGKRQTTHHTQMPNPRVAQPSIQTFPTVNNFYTRTLFMNESRFAWPYPQANRFYNPITFSTNDQNVPVPLEQIPNYYIPKNNDVASFDQNGPFPLNYTAGSQDNSVNENVVMRPMLVKTVTMDTLGLGGKIFLYDGTFLPDGNLLMSDVYNKRILMFDADINFVTQYQLVYEPTGICIGPDGNTVYVVCDYKFVVGFSLLDEFQETDKISVAQDAVGLGIEGDTIIVGHYHNVSLYHKDGREIRLISKDGGDTSICMTSTNSSLFYHKDGDQIVCQNMEDRTEIFRYRNQNLKYPHGISCDRYGNIMVAGFYSKNIHLVSSNGQVGRVLVDKLRYINCPVAVCCHPHRDVFVVSSRQENVVMEVYEIQVPYN